MSQREGEAPLTDVLFVDHVGPGLEDSVPGRILEAGTQLPPGSSRQSLSPEDLAGSWVRSKDFAIPVEPSDWARVQDWKAGPLHKILLYRPLMTDVRAIDEELIGFRIRRQGETKPALPNF
jgi:hypothetical protein